MDVLMALGEAAPLWVLGAAALVFPLLFFVSAPYGRHARPGWGPLVPARWGWVLMEAPCLALFALVWWHNAHRFEPTVALLAALWLLHYGHRTVVFPALLRPSERRHPVLTIALAVVFNTLNATGNGVALAPQPVSWTLVLGLVLFGCGLGIHLHADAVLRSLRPAGETGYRIPRGGLYRYVSSPNYLGEMLEWGGFALAAGTLAGLAFFVFTVANLLPRALSHHRWYRARFPDYPQERRALIPFVF